MFTISYYSQSCLKLFLILLNPIEITKNVVSNLKQKTHFHDMVDIPDFWQLEVTISPVSLMYF